MRNPVPRNWRDIHGDDFEVPRQVESLLKDNSESNDSCPKFELEYPHFILQVFIDHPIPKLREVGGRRFEVAAIYVDHLEEVGSINLLQTDDLPELLSLVHMVREANQS